MSKANLARPLPQPADPDLPEGWVTCGLADIVSPSKQKVHPDDCPDIPYLSLEHIESGTGRILSQGVGSDVSSTKAVFRAGDVLYGKLRPYLNKVCIPDFDGICSTDIFVFPASEFVAPRLLMRFLMLPHVVAFANQHMSGVQLPRISFKKLGELEFTLPPWAEQKRIVTKTEDLLTQVRAARERLEKVPAILKRFRQSVLAAACSGRLTAEWREHGSRADVAGLLQAIGASRVDAPEWAGELPDTWAWVAFSSVTVNHDGKRIPVKSDDRAKRRGQYPYYGASGIIDSIDDFLFDGEYLLIAEDGANLLSRSTPIAFRALGKFWVNNHAHVVQTRADIPLQYVECYLNWLDLQHYVTGTAQPKLTQGALNSIPVPLPPLDEQREIVRRVENLFGLADAVEKRVASATKRADKLTQAILARAFRGELVPTEAELAGREGRDYEPASALLERIKAARETQPKRKKRRSKMPPKTCKACKDAKRLPLVETLRKAGKRLKPEDLFARAGFSSDTVDEFYEELRTAVQAGDLREHRPNEQDVFLEATHS